MCLVYNVSLLFIFIPSTSTFNRTINIVTDTVKAVKDCPLVPVPLFLNGKFAQCTKDHKV